MVKKIYKTLTLTQVVTGFILMISLWVDSIIIGKYCNGNCLAAYGYVMPAMLLFNAIGQTLAQGNLINCSEQIGLGNRNEVNKFFSTGCTTTLLFGVVSIIIIMLFRTQLSVFLGPTQNTEVFFRTNDYILGLAPGIPFILLTLILTPFLQLMGQQNRLIIGALAMIGTDIALNFVAVYFFKHQMIGIGLASSASYFICLVILLSYFFSKQCKYKFYIKKFDFTCLAKILKKGSPTLINLFCSVLLSYSVNILLGRLDGDYAVAAYSIISNVMNFCYIFSNSIATVTLTATTLFNSEYDRKSLIEVLNIMIKIMLISGIIIVLLVDIFAGSISSFFIGDEPLIAGLATIGMRILMCSFFCSAFTAGFKAFYQGMGYLKYLKAIIIFQNFLGTVIASTILGKFYGATGVFCGFLVCEILTLLIIYTVSVVKSKSFSISTNNLALLPPDYGKSIDSIIVSIKNKNDLKTMWSDISDFCKIHQVKDIIANQITNDLSILIETCYHANIKPNKIAMNILIQNCQEKIKIRFRDNGTNWESNLNNSELNDKYDYSTIMGINNITLELNNIVNVKY